ncbi:MAG TPA: TIGR03013 family XrtA/PEP-CTERM system glycosyltransferase [Vicinamibacterales bacterium]|jgi:sugar transferase (PEP-CTERM system associated)
MQVFNRQVSGRSVTVFAFEVMLVSGSVGLATELHGSTDLTFFKIALVTVVCQLCFYYNDLYDLTIVQSNRELVVRLLQASGMATIILAALVATLPSISPDAGTFVTALGVFVTAMLTWRLTFNRVARDPRLEERILILGTGAAARMLAQEIGSQQDFAYRIVGFVDESDEPDADGPNDVLGGAHDIGRLVLTYHIERIIVSLSDRRGHLPIDDLLRAKLSGVRVEDAATTYERLTGKILIDGLKPSSLVFSDGFRASRATRTVKRMLDLAVAGTGFLLAWPLMILTAIAVRLDSDGPILYSQERVGEGGRVFTLYKFRSMRVDAENGTPIWADGNDPRVTHVGRFIRLTRLDELPQLWNVLRGDMSFVGPRPERPYFVEQLAAAIPFYVERHSVKPGVTGWAQVKYRYGSSVDDAMEKLRYDLYYIKHLSISFDLTIALDTVKVILSAKGAQ